MWAWIPYNHRDRPRRVRRTPGEHSPAGSAAAYAAWPDRTRCADTLCDRLCPERGKAGEVGKIIVEVMLKREIHDPQGEAISRACQRLGFGDVVGVRQGKRFEVELRGPADAGALTRAEEIAGELLSNPVIEEFALYEG